jgi:hypothetical protein
LNKDLQYYADCGRNHAVAGDVADVKRNMATKDQIIAPPTKVNSIETELRGMNHAKLHAASLTSRKKSPAQPAPGRQPPTLWDQ